MKKKEETKQVEVAADPEGLLDEREVARITRMSVSTVQKWRFDGIGPKYLKIGKSVRYRLADVRRFINSLPSAGGKPLHA
jgi:predicted DNA-binding transcriptional regulator AlpA